MIARLLVAAAFIALALCGPAQAKMRDGLFGSAYKEAGRCGAFARVTVRTPAWACVGIVAGRQHGLIHPRTIVEVAPHRFVIADMFGWDDDGQRGRLLRLDVAADGTAKVTALVKGLTTPHGLARGPDG